MRIESGGWRILRWGLVLSALALVPSARPATITPQGGEQWARAVQLAKEELAAGLCDPEHFFVAAARPGVLERVQAGRIVVDGARRGGMEPVPAGLIHHWIGSVRVPAAHADDLLTALQDYDNYSQIYPAVIESKPLTQHGNEFTYRLKFAHKGFGIQAGLLGEFRSTYVRLDADSGYMLTESTSLTELENAGRANERPLSFADSNGYVERMFTVVRYRESRDGLYVQVEALTLSRDIPGSIRWLVSPVVQKFSRQVLAITLESLRQKVQVESGRRESLGMEARQRLSFGR